MTVTVRVENAILRTDHPIIWMWSGYLKSDEAQIKMACKTCCRQYQQRWNTQQIYFYHLKRFHPHDHRKRMKMCLSTPSFSRTSRAVPKQKTIMSTFASIAMYEKQLWRNRDITNAVPYLFKDTMPLSTVESKVLDCRCKIPGRKYLSQTALVFV